MSMYFDCLPGDLITSLFLYYSSAEILQIIPELRNFNCFTFLYTPIRHKEVWPMIYQRDISSCTKIHEGFAYEEYKIIFEQLKNFDIYYQVKYLAENGYDILLNPLVTNNMLAGDAATYALRNKHNEIAKKFIPLSSNCTLFNKLLADSANMGDMEMINFLIKHGANAWDMLLVCAAQNGHLEIFEKFLNKKLYVTYDIIMMHGAHGGHMNIVDKMLDLGAKDYRRSLDAAAGAGKLEMVKFMLSLIEKDEMEINYDDAIILAAEGNHFEIVRLLLNKGITDPQWVLKSLENNCSILILGLIKNHMQIEQK